MKRFWSSVACLGVIASALAASPAGAESTLLYVDRDSVGGACSDARAVTDVTASTPWCTPVRAMTAAPEGATVLLRKGTYSEVKALNVARTQFLTFKAAPGETVTLTGTSTSNTDLTTRALYLNNSSHLRFEGLTIVGGTYVRNSSFVQFSNNIVTTRSMRLRNVSDALVENNEFRNFFGTERAFEATANVGEPGVKRLVVRANEFHSIEHDAIGLFWRLEDVTVEDNYIHNIHRPAGSTLHTDALQIGPQSEGSYGAIIVRRNRIVDYDDGFMIKDGITRGLVIENNVLGPAGVLAAHIYGAPGARITNNTLAGGNLYLRAGTTDAVVTNNVLNKFPIDSTASVAVSNYNLVDRSAYNPGYVPGTGDIDGKPTFVNPAAGDFSLTSTSLGIDMANTANNAPTEDLLKRPRPSGPVPDMGAYELQTAVAPPPSDPVAPPSSDPVAPPPSDPVPPPSSDLVPTTTTFSLDSFTDTAGKLLSSHLGDLGTNWSMHKPYGAGTAKITSANSVRSSSSSNAGYMSGGVPTSSQYDVEAKLTVMSGLATRAGITGRVSVTTNNFYGVRYDTAAKAWKLSRYRKGKEKSLGTYPETLAAGAVRTVKLQIRATSKKVFINGVERISSTNDEIGATGRGGVYFSGAASTDTTGIHLDDFSVKSM